MKIFFLASSFPSYADPSRGIFNYRFAKQMVLNGESIDIVFFRTWLPGRKIKSSYNYDGLKVTQICLPIIPFDSQLFLKINNWVLSSLFWTFFRKILEDAEIIHSIYLSANGVIAGEWAKKMKVVHVSQAIGSDVNSDMIRKSDRKYFGKAIKKIDGIITNSKDLEKKIRFLFPDHHNIKTIYRGIDLEYSENCSAINGKQNFRFLYLGGLGPNKRLKFGLNTKGGLTLMEAWKKNESDMASLNATLLFGGPDSENESYAAWKETLKFPGLVKNIGKVHPDEVKGYLKNCNFVVIPSMEEGMPNLLLESQVSGTPVIGSDAGGIPEVIVDGETGFIFSKGNDDELGKLLIEAAKDVERGQLMGEKAQERIRSSFNASNYSDNVMEFYKRTKDVWNSRYH